MLTGALQMKLLPTDNPHNFARLLIRLLPASDYTKTGTMMSTLRILAENPHVASASTLPKFQIDSTMDKFKGMFKGKDAVSRLVEGLHQYLTQQSVTIKLPTSVFTEHVPPGNITVADRDDFFAQNRLWIIPRVTNYSSREAKVEFAKFERIGVGRDKLLPFVTSPLVSLGSWVQSVSRAENGLGVVSGELPFR
jgi:hypothetical protein